MKITEVANSELTESDWGYFAGIIDGEGCISIHRQKYRNSPTAYHQLHFKIENTNRNLCDWLVLKFGGHYTVSRKERPGKNWKTSYRWQLNNADAGNILRLVIPYLKLKKAQAENGLRFCDLGFATGRRILSPEVVRGREQIWQSNRELNKVGIWAR